MPVQGPYHWLRHHDHRWLERVHGWAHRRFVRRVAWTMSRLGNIDGCMLMWAALAWIAPVAGLRMLLAGSVGVLVYKFLKHRLKRPRPYVRHAHLVARATPPDEFSFPSGHALHASALALIVTFQWPWLWPLALLWLVAMGTSRVMLSMHYPSDVLVGTGLGLLLGTLALGLKWPI